jgi:type IV pilus assembly protein PilA
MFRKLKNKMKDQRGLTLIELLAVIVILAIIAAIAIPSIMGLIDNSKKDAHVANAQQMINSAKIAVTADKELMPEDGNLVIVTLKYLEDEGYLETIKDPDGDEYIRASAAAETTRVSGTTVTPSDNSYVVIENDDNKLKYSVRLYAAERGVEDDTANMPVLEKDLSRNSVRP